MEEEMEATASSASRTGSTTGGEDSSAVASVGGNPEGSAGCVAVVSVGGNPAVGGVGGRGDSEGGREAAVGGRAAASRRESDWRGAAVGGLRWGGRATGLNLFWLAAGGQCGGECQNAYSRRRRDIAGDLWLQLQQQLKNKNNPQHHASNPTPVPTPRLPIRLPSPRLSPKSVCESGLCFCTDAPFRRPLIHPHPHSYTHHVRPSPPPHSPPSSISHRSHRFPSRVLLHKAHHRKRELSLAHRRGGRPAMYVSALVLSAYDCRLLQTNTNTIPDGQ